MAELEAEVRRAYADWQERKGRAERALQEASEAFSAVDREFTDKWAQGMLDDLPDALRDMQRAIETEDFDRVPGDAQAVKAKIQAAIEHADETYAKEQKRIEIVKGIRSALRDMGFEAGATLSDKGDATSDVIISANHPSQRKVEMEVDLETQHIQMNLDDDETTGTRVGADCVADVKDLIRRLGENGIQMEMTDWGYADPERVRPEGAQIQHAQRQAQREA